MISSTLRFDFFHFHYYCLLSVDLHTCYHTPIYKKDILNKRNILLFSDLNNIDHSKIGKKKKTRPPNRDLHHQWWDPKAALLDSLI